MAFSTGGSGSGFRGRRRLGASYGALSEINVVPLVDVVLVLLIIFMLTAHVMDYGLDIDVPKTKATKESTEQLVVVGLKRNELYLNDKPIKLNDLAAQLAKRTKDQKDVYFAADSATRWDLIAQVLTELSLAKVTPKVVTKPIDKAGR